MFIEKLDLDGARRAIAAGRQVYEWKTKDPHQLPIVGPAYDDHPSRNRAKKDGRFAATVEEAEAAAKRVNTVISQVFFLAE